MAIRPEDSILWKVAPKLAARLHPDDLVAVEPDGPVIPTPEQLDLLRRLGCPTVVRQQAERRAS